MNNLYNLIVAIVISSTIGETTCHEFNVLFADFEELGKAYDKARRVVESDGIPSFYIGILVELEDFINEVMVVFKALV